jgi:putative oxidoreductase
MLKSWLSSPLDQDTKGSLGLLVGRLMFGPIMAFAHGMGKVPPPQGLIDAVTAMGLPLPGFMAWAAGLAEFVGGLMIAVGLFTRPAAVLWLVTMAVAAFVAHGADPFQKKELALLYLSFAVVVLALGGGKFSLDHLLDRKLSKS